MADTGGPGLSPRVADHVVVDIEGATYDGKLLATIRFTVTCDELTYFDWDQNQEVTTTAGFLWPNAGVRQAQGRSIASASGFGPQTAVTCDGVTVNHLSVQVLSENLPLKRGSAVAGVTAEVGAGEAYEFGASGPTTIRLR